MLTAPIQLSRQAFQISRGAEQECGRPRLRAAGQMTVFARLP